jgi:hypothetical protein
LNSVRFKTSQPECSGWLDFCYQEDKFPPACAKTGHPMVALWL